MTVIFILVNKEKYNMAYVYKHTYVKDSVYKL